MLCSRVVRLNQSLQDQVVNIDLNNFLLFWNKYQIKEKNNSYVRSFTNQQRLLKRLAPNHQLFSSQLVAKQFSRALHYSCMCCMAWTSSCMCPCIFLQSAVRLRRSIAVPQLLIITPPIEEDPCPQGPAKETVVLS